MPKLKAGVEMLLANCLTHGAAKFCGGGGELSQRVPVCAGNAGRRVCQRCRDERAEDDAGGAVGIPPAAQPAPDGGTEGVDGGAVPERKVEPNSGLGKAIAYLQKHWSKLTLFLREPGAPLDNYILTEATPEWEQAKEFNAYIERRVSCAANRGEGQLSIR